MERGMGLRVMGVALGALMLGWMVSRASAGPTVNYYITTVNATAAGGTWQVYADVSRDNDGLANYEIDMFATGGASFITPATLEAPHPIDPTGQYAGAMGFNADYPYGLGFENPLASYGGIVTASQNDLYGSNENAKFGMGVLVGVGQEDSGLSPQNGTQGPIDGSGEPTGIATPVWGYVPFGYYSGGNGLYYPVAGTLIAEGQYATDGESTAAMGISSTGPLLGYCEVLGTGGAIPPGGLNYPGMYPSGDNVPWGYDPYQAGNLPMASGAGDAIVLVPEPATVSLLGFFGVGMMMRRRRGKC